ncbi:Crp/Fnr family transcriptional regulator [Aphanothece stagnina]|uniref:Crp/Fnr family transcriptional regulator n=3 Tax=Aphanothece TaxID=1121 RepID=UPI00398F5C29
MTSDPTDLKVQRLREVGIFSATPEDLLRQLADALAEVELAPGEPLFAKDDLGTCMYVVVSGLVRVHLHDQTVAELGPGEIVGELAALDPEPRSASVSALEPTCLYQIEQATLEDLMEVHPKIMKAVIASLAHRLRATTAPYGQS